MIMVFYGGTICTYTLAEYVETVVEVENVTAALQSFDVGIAVDACAIVLQIV